MCYLSNGYLKTVHGPMFSLKPYAILKYLWCNNYEIFLSFVEYFISVWILIQFTLWHWNRPIITIMGQHINFFMKIFYITTLLVTGLGKSRAIPLLPLWAFVACSRVTFTLLVKWPSIIHLTYLKDTCFQQVVMWQ
jgi:hypothetical protein